MKTIDLISKRLDWTRAWLRDVDDEAPTSPDGFELVDANECLSEHGLYTRDEDERDDAFVLVDVNLDGEMFMLPRDVRPRSKDEILEESVYWDYFRDPFFTEFEWQLLGPEEQYEALFGTMQSKDANEYETAGRNPENTFRDIRSARTARDRCRKQADKYWGFRMVSREQIGRPHHGTRNKRGHVQWCRDSHPGAPTFVMTAGDLYRVAQMAPRPPKVHHRHRDKSHNPLERQGNKHWRYMTDLDVRIPHVEVKHGRSH